MKQSTWFRIVHSETDVYMALCIPGGAWQKWWRWQSSTSLTPSFLPCWMVRASSIIRRLNPKHAPRQPDNRQQWVRDVQIYSTERNYFIHYQNPRRRRMNDRCGVLRWQLWGKLILGCSTRDHGRNTDMTKELALDKDIVEMVRARRLSYFGHVVRIWATRDTRSMLLYGHIQGSRPEDGRRRGGWITLWKTAKYRVCLFLMPTYSPMTEFNGDNLDLHLQKLSCQSALIRRRRQSIKSSKTSKW